MRDTYSFEIKAVIVIACIFVIIFSLWVTVLATESRIFAFAWSDPTPTPRWPTPTVPPTPEGGGWLRFLALTNQPGHYVVRIGGDVVASFTVSGDDRAVMEWRPNE